MREDPPADLVHLLGRLGLASAADFRAVYDRVKRLTHDLPLFRQVWVDALAQARRITPYQAAQLNAGRGEQLAVGPFVITRHWHSIGYADCFHAKDTTDGAAAHLLTATLPAGGGEQVADGLAQLIARMSGLRQPTILKVKASGRDGDRLWIASEPPHGVSAATWVVQHGRLGWKIVLEIARQMAAALAELESAEIVHGDIAASALWFEADGGDPTESAWNPLPHPAAGRFRPRRLAARGVRLSCQ